MACDRGHAALRVRGAIERAAGHPMPARAFCRTPSEPGTRNLQPDTAIRAVESMYNKMGIDYTTDPNALALINDIQNGTLTLTNKHEKVLWRAQALIDEERDARRDKQAKLAAARKERRDKQAAQWDKAYGDKGAWAVPYLVEPTGRYDRYPTSNSLTNDGEALIRWTTDECEIGMPGGWNEPRTRTGTSYDIDTIIKLNDNRDGTYTLPLGEDDDYAYGIRINHDGSLDRVTYEAGTAEGTNAWDAEDIREYAEYRGYDDEVDLMRSNDFDREHTVEVLTDDNGRPFALMLTETGVVDEAEYEPDPDDRDR